MNHFCFGWFVAFSFSLFCLRFLFCICFFAVRIFSFVCIFFAFSLCVCFLFCGCVDCGSTWMSDFNQERSNLPVFAEVEAPVETRCCWTGQRMNRFADSASAVRIGLRPCWGLQGIGSAVPRNSVWWSTGRSPARHRWLKALIYRSLTSKESFCAELVKVSTWAARWFSLATRARLSLMVISKSCRTGASAGLAPPAHFKRCSMLASSDSIFSWYITVKSSEKDFSVFLNIYKQHLIESYVSATWFFLWTEAPFARCHFKWFLYSAYNLKALSMQTARFWNWDPRTETTSQSKSAWFDFLTVFRKIVTFMLMPTHTNNCLRSLPLPCNWKHLALGRPAPPSGVINKATNGTFLFFPLNYFYYSSGVVAHIGVITMLPPRWWNSSFHINIVLSHQSELLGWRCSTSFFSIFLSTSVGASSLPLACDNVEKLAENHREAPKHVCTKHFVLWTSHGWVHCCSQ